MKWKLSVEVQEDEAKRKANKCGECIMINKILKKKCQNKMVKMK